MKIQNLKTTETNGIITAEFNSDNCAVKFQISLLNLLAFKDTITPAISDRAVFKHDLIWILSHKFLTHLEREAA